MAKTATKKAPAKAAGAKKKVTPTGGAGTPEKTFQAMKDQILTMEDDMDKFLVNEVKSAGKRCRAGAQNLKKLAQGLRKEIQALVVERKGGTKKKK